MTPMATPKKKVSTQTEDFETPTPETVFRNGGALANGRSVRCNNNGRSSELLQQRDEEFQQLRKDFTTKSNNRIFHDL